MRQRRRRSWGADARLFLGVPLPAAVLRLHVHPRLLVEALRLVVLAVHRQRRSCVAGRSVTPEALLQQGEGEPTAPMLGQHGELTHVAVTATVPGRGDA